MAHDIQFALRVARVAIAHPVEAVDRLRIWREDRTSDEPAALPPLEPDVDRAMHEFIGEADCATCAEEFAEVSAATARRLSESTYHDASTALANAVWIATRHLRPERAVETGVGQGVTTNCILTAMNRNELGHLTSIDLPPLSTAWHGSVAGAVDPSVRGRWTYERGAVRRKLPDVLAKNAPVGLFVHDALHTYTSMEFEFRTAWDRLLEGGLLIADDVALNGAFPDFAVGKAHALVAEPAKRGAIGIVRKHVPA